MATEILPAGDSAAESSDVTLADGATAILAITSPANNEAMLWIELHVGGSGTDSPPTDEWARVGRLTPGAGSSAAAVIGPGTYRLARKAGVSCGGARA